MSPTLCVGPRVDREIVWRWNTSWPSTTTTTTVGVVPCCAVPRPSMDICTCYSTPYPSSIWHIIEKYVIRRPNMDTCIYSKHFETNIDLSGMNGPVQMPRPTGCYIFCNGTAIRAVHGMNSPVKWRPSPITYTSWNGPFLTVVHLIPTSVWNSLERIAARRWLNGSRANTESKIAWSTYKLVCFTRTQSYT